MGIQRVKPKVIDLGKDGSKWKHGYIPENAAAEALKHHKSPLVTGSGKSPIIPKGHTVRESENAQGEKVAYHYDESGKHIGSVVHLKNGFESFDRNGIQIGGTHGRNLDAHAAIVSHASQKVQPKVDARFVVPRGHNSEARGGAEARANLAHYREKGAFGSQPGESRFAPKPLEAPKAPKDGEARTRVTPKTYRGVEGHAIVGHDTKGRKVSVHVPGSLAEARVAQSRIHNGKPAFESSSSGIVGRLPSSQEAKQARDAELLRNAEQMYGSDMKKWPRSALKRAAAKGSEQAKTLLAGSVGAR